MSESAQNELPLPSARGRRSRPAVFLVAALLTVLCLPGCGGGGGASSAGDGGQPPGLAGGNDPESMAARLQGGGPHVDWPADVSGVLVGGDASRGEELYASAGCAACHGDPGQPGSNILAPPLDDIATEAAHRQAGTSSAQYIYDSILHPNDAIAPACKDGAPCAEPSAMPSYAGLLRKDEMADLLTYLESLRG